MNTGLKICSTLAVAVAMVMPAFGCKKARETREAPREDISATPVNPTTPPNPPSPLGFDDPASKVNPSDVPPLGPPFDLTFREQSTDTAPYNDLDLGINNKGLNLGASGQRDASDSSDASAAADTQARLPPESTDMSARSTPEPVPPSMIEEQVADIIQPVQVVPLTEAGIRDLQAALVLRGAENLRVDGILGKQTREAIESFQITNDLNVTGNPDPATMDKLGLFAH